jgi:hypothetical protein
VPWLADDPLLGKISRSDVLKWMKVLVGRALLRTTGFLESLLRFVSLDWTVPDFSTLSCRQRTLAANIRHRGSKRPLQLSIPCRAMDGAKQRVWRKIHLGIDREKMKFRAVETGGSCVEMNHPEHFSAVPCRAVDA